MRGPICLLVLAAFACLPAFSQDDSTRALAAARDLGKAFSSVAKAVTPAVVNISSTHVEPGRRLAMSPMLRGLFPDMESMFVQPPREFRSLGSGVIIRPEGYIVTNSHVIQGAQEIKVKLSDNTEHDGKIVGADGYTDLAVIQIDGRDLPVLQFGDSEKLEVGEWVIAVGSPLGLEQTVTAGIVSAKGRKNLGIQGYEDFIQTDAAINPGNSGGALVNLDGKLVGINTAIASEGGGYDGVCFATPSSIVGTVVDVLIRDGKIRRPWLGVMPEAADSRALAKLGVSAGVLVGNMIRNGPAHLGRLAPGDVIIKWNDSDVKSRAELSELVQATVIGAEATIIIMREGKKYKATVTILERPQTVQIKGVI